MTAVAESVDTASIGRLLQQRHDEAAEQVRRLQDQTESMRGSHDAGAGDAADVGTLALEAAEQAMVTMALQEQMTRLQAALKRLDDGTLGVCQRCSTQIPVTRLQVMPWATHCVPCQSIVDRYR
ncbi:TraR/DksA family transcriptional regulator [Catellatospora vulcania]|uniref:TraR/DksA family transcriptional regulator n=1 Tax=Catellatospora vulcania TaxID=1460450 RepID=UPI0012D3748F|nr:TraR/DksA C4-type zinc finger protein [Catellatospora vulcania]